MDRKNIRKIMESDLWRDITKHAAFRNFVIVPSISGYGTSLQSLWVFFTSDIFEHEIRGFASRGKHLAGREALDNNPTIKCYGLKVLVFS